MISLVKTPSVRRMRSSAWAAGHMRGASLPKRKKYSSRARQGALDLTIKLYGGESDLKESSDEGRKTARRERSLRLLTRLKNCLEQTQPPVTTGYLVSNRSKLERYVEHGFMKIDSNISECAIRDFIIGSKKRLFSDTSKGAAVRVQLYSLVGTAKANDQELSAWLRPALERLPKASSVEDYEVVLWWNRLPQMHLSHISQVLKRLISWSACHYLTCISG